MESLLIIGAGKYGKLVKELAEALGYEKIGFLDDSNPMAIGKIRDAVIAIVNIPWHFEPPVRSLRATLPFETEPRFR